MQITQIMRRLILPALILIPVLSGCGGANTGETAGDPEPASRIETVTTDSFAMDYFQFGHGPKTLVILPGLSVQSVMGSAEAVAAAYQPLTDDYTIYLFDRRKELPPSYSVYEMAQDTAEAFRVLGLEQVDLFGVSQGGMIAAEIAIRYPELVHKLVLGSTAARIGEAEFQTVEKWIALARAADAQGLYLAFGEALYPEEVFEQSRELLADAARSVTDEDLRRFVILAEGMRGFDVTEDLGAIACPVMVIGSMDDRVVGPEASFQIAWQLKGRPDAVLFMYGGYGHAAYDTAPDYKDRLLQFFAPGSAD